MPGDLVIVISYGDYAPEELAAGFSPTIVFVDAANRRVLPESAAERTEGEHEA